MQWWRQEICVVLKTVMSSLLFLIDLFNRFSSNEAGSWTSLWLRSVGFVCILTWEMNVYEGTNATLIKMLSRLFEYCLFDYSRQETWLPLLAEIKFYMFVCSFCFVLSLLHSLQDHSRFVNCVRFSPDGSRYVSAGADGQVKLKEMQMSHLKRKYCFPRLWNGCHLSVF